MKSRALGHKSDKSCNHREDLFLLWTFFLFQGCKLSYWWYLGWTHSSLKECILLHFHVKGVHMLWGSLSAAGCSARDLSILFKIITPQCLKTSCGKGTSFCVWYLLLEALWGPRGHSPPLGERCRNLGWLGLRDPDVKGAYGGSVSHILCGPYGPVSAALSVGMSKGGDVHRSCTVGLAFPLATGAVMDGPHGCREEQGAMLGLCHAGAVLGATRLASARGQPPLHFTSTFTSVGICGPMWEGGHPELWQHGVTWLSIVPDRDPSIPWISLVQPGQVWDRSSGNSAWDAKSISCCGHGLSWLPHLSKIKTHLFPCSFPL